ncbi:MAG: hypothetical protein LUO93_10420, partial [Methanomicrobiales archaeon]|nr:hypothetical protein [Methanomicrobiales archaeon]
RNPWFETDQVAQAAATAEINRLAAQKLPIEEQLDGAEALIRKRFPEYFGQAERAEPAEARLSEVRPAPPAVQRGTRGGESRPKEKGFADIPPGDRASYIRYFAKNYESYGLKPEEAQARYAKAYWSNKDEA